MDQLPMDQLPTELNLVTLNCWGLRYGLSTLRTERLLEIGRQLAALDPPPHIVALQECWSEADDFAAIRRETRAVLPHAKFYHAGAFGAGLAVLSRWPIEESSMVRFPLSGRPTAFFRGDWFVGKGIACATIRCGPAPEHVIQVFNTHLHAAYHEILDSYDTYACHRMAQAWELAKLIRAASERGRLVLAMGDFNTVPSSVPYRLLTAHAPVRDAWLLLHPDSCPSFPGRPASPPHAHSDPAPPYNPPPSPSFNVSEHGVTIKSVLNTWAWTRRQRRELIGPEKMPCRVPPDAVDNHTRRIDYIFAGCPAATSTSHHPDGPGLGRTASRWVLQDAQVGMTKRHPLLDVSLSDHFSVHATLKLTSPAPALAPQQPAAPPPNGHHHPSTPPTSGASENNPGGPQESRGADDALTVDDSIVHSGVFLQASSPTTSQFRFSLAVDPTDPQFDFPPSAYDEVLASIDQYRMREQNHRRWRTIHFATSLVVGAACLVAVFFSPANWVAFILMLVAMLSLVAGTLDGLLALLFFNAELRALSEFEWEILNAKAATLGLAGPPSRAGSGEK